MKEKYIEDLREIRDIMHRSTRIISLSGISGVTTGIIALTGVYLAYTLLFSGEDYLTYQPTPLSDNSLVLLLVLAFSTLLLSSGSAVFFTMRKEKKQHQKTWDLQSKRLLTSLLIPLISGGLLCLILLFKGLIGILPGLTLVFYGLALVNASKYTFKEINTLGILEIILGILAIQFITYSLYLWAIGFGVLHIVYGIMVERRSKA